MILYLDTSALVKLYVREPGSATVRRLANRAQALATSVVAYAETHAAFARLNHRGNTTAARHQERLRQFNVDWGALLRVEVTPEILRSAGDLANIHYLRGFDSIHLASALWLRARSSHPIEFAAFDQRLRAAASAAGLSVAPKL